MDASAPPPSPPAAPASGTDNVEPRVCPNCGATGRGAYCAGCGQRHVEGRLTLRGLWQDFVSRAFSLDRGLLHTLARLAGGPGRVPADYVAGRRRQYTHPLSFYLLTAAVYLFSTGLYQETIVRELGADASPVVSFEIDDGAAPAADSLSVRQRLGATVREMNGADETGVMRRLSQIQRRVTTPLLVFFALFLVLPLRLFFGPRRNLAEIAIFTLYTVGLGTLAIAVLGPLLFVALPFRAASIAQSAATLAVYPGVAAWGATVFWRPGLRTVLKAGAAALLGGLVYSFASGLVALALLLDEVLGAAGLTWADLLGA